MSTWLCVSAMARTTTFRMGGLSRTTDLGTPQATRRSSSPPNPIRRFEPEPTSSQYQSLLRASSPTARSRRKWNLTERLQTPISGGALTPGQPADFRLGPVDSPILFNRDRSFQLEVPEAASRITFTLESVDPDVDVDLYVRFGEDNDMQDGRPVFDHASWDSRVMNGSASPADPIRRFEPEPTSSR